MGVKIIVQKHLRTCVQLVKCVVINKCKDALIHAVYAPSRVHMGLTDE